MNDKNYCYRYPRPAVTTDCVIFGFDGRKLNVLLVERGNEPFKGQWAFPGGFLKENESPDACAVRELREETGLEGAYIEQFHAYGEADRDPREHVVTIAYIALVKITEVRGGDDAADARWFPVDGIPPLAFDHDKILKDALVRLRERTLFYPVGKDLLPEKFSMPALQTFYESVLGLTFDRRNFAKKMLRLGLIEIEEDCDSDEASAKRRGVLYRFNLERYDELKKKGFRNEF